MKYDQTVKIEIRSIANGYLVSSEKREGYRAARTDLTYYPGLADIEDRLVDLLVSALDLDVPEASEDEEGMPF